MKNFLIIIIALSFCLVGCSNNKTENVQENTSDNYTASRTATSDNKNSSNSTPAPKPEEDISSFSTKIYIKESGRQHNIRINLF